MKKQVLISVFFVVVMLFSANVFAQYPIASYNVPVDQGTYFTQSQTTNPAMSAERRKMNINTTGGGSAPTNQLVTFVVYSLDMQTFKGPYTIQVGNSKKINIDERPWGVTVLREINGDCLMSVYTDSSDN